jgi:hypothetical protein
VSNSSSSLTASSATRAKKHSASLKLSCPECFYAKYPNSGKCTNRECTQSERSSRAMTSDELLREFEPPPLFHGRRWGAWTLDTERACLVYDAWQEVRGNGSGVTKGVPQYTAYLGAPEIDLDRIRDSAGLLDWIYQVEGKTWATARITKDLLSAFDAIFSPQQNLCTGGGSKTIANPTTFLRGRFKMVQW